MIRVKQLENFWYYHKMKVIVTASAIIAIIIYLSLSGKNIKPDVTIVYITDGRTISSKTEENAKDYLVPIIQDVNKDRIKNIDFLPLTGLKIEFELLSGESQIVLLDRNSLKKYIGTGAFEPIDNLVQKFNIDLSKNPEVESKTDIIDEVHTYAIPVGDLPFLLNMGFPKKDYYLTIRATDKKNKSAVARNENAHLIIDAIIKYTE